MCYGGEDLIPFCCQLIALLCGPFPEINAAGNNAGAADQPGNERDDTIPVDAPYQRRDQKSQRNGPEQRPSPKTPGRVKLIQGDLKLFVKFFFLL